jgi:hypothetical protein
VNERRRNTPPAKSIGGVVDIEWLRSASEPDEVQIRGFRLYAVTANCAEDQESSFPVQLLNTVPGSGHRQLANNTTQVTAKV